MNVTFLMARDIVTPFGVRSVSFGCLPPPIEMWAAVIVRRMVSCGIRMIGTPQATVLTSQF